MSKIRHIIFSAIALIITACTGVPSGVIPPEDMAQLIADFHVGEAVVDMNRQEFDTDSLRQLYKQSVFAAHGYTSEQVDSSLAWYGRNTLKYIDVYDRALEILDNRLIETGNRIAAEAALSIAGDSVDVWPWARFVSFGALSPSMIAPFDFLRDENWEPGDSYTWRAKLFNNTENPRFNMVVEYSDGTAETASKVAPGDGWNEIVFPTDSTRTATRIYGYFEGAFRPGTTLRADSIQLIRKRVDHINRLPRHLVNTIENIVPAAQAETDTIR